MHINKSRTQIAGKFSDYSRAVAGYMIFLGAPSALHTSLALRQAIWRKQNPSWPVSGIPDVLYVDHGSDFTSIHLDKSRRRCGSNLSARQGRGKIEHFFGTINTELLPKLAGRLIKGKPASAPAQSLLELDAAIAAFVVGVYHTRPHSQTEKVTAAAMQMAEKKV